MCFHCSLMPTYSTKSEVRPRWPAAASKVTVVSTFASKVTFIRNKKTQHDANLTTVMAKSLPVDFFFVYACIVAFHLWPTTEQNKLATRDSIWIRLLSKFTFHSIEHLSFDNVPFVYWAIIKHFHSLAHSSSDAQQRSVRHEAWFWVAAWRFCFVAHSRQRSLACLLLSFVSGCSLSFSLSSLLLLGLLFLHLYLTISVSPSFIYWSFLHSSLFFTTKSVSFDPWNSF